MENNEESIGSMQMQHDKQITMLNQAKEAVEAILNAMGMANLQETVMEVKLENDGPESHTDPELSVGGVIAIVAQVLAYDTIAGKRFRPGYVIGYEKIHPGCRTLANGDPGYPDELEFIEEGEAQMPEVAAMQALSLAFTNLVGMAAQNLDEAKMYEEEL